MKAIPKNISINRRKIQYATAGKGTPILLIHGSPGGWDQMIAEFGYLIDEGFQLISPSRPGYCSTPLKSGETVTEQADLLAHLMKYLQIEQYIIIAWSGGGPIAIQLAAQHPQQVKGLYLQACVTKSYTYTKQAQKAMEPLFNPFNAFMIKCLIKWAPKMVLFQTVKTSYQCSSEMARNRLKGLLKDRGIIPYIQQLAGSVVPPSKRKKGFRNDIKQFANLDNLSLTEVEAPTLIIQGSTDKEVAMDNAIFAAEQISHADLEVYKDVTHEPRLSELYPNIKKCIVNFLKQFR